MKITTVVAVFAIAANVGLGAFAGTCNVKMLPGEHWWGVCNAFGRQMPFGEGTKFSCDLRKDNYAHQALSFLCSDKGRAIWCPEPVAVSIAKGEIALESDKGDIVLKEDAGRSLAEAYRYGSRTWFPPTGEEKDRAVALMRRVEAGVNASMSYCINRSVSISSVWYYIARRLDKAVIFGVERLPRIGV